MALSAAALSAEPPASVARVGRRENREGGGGLQLKRPALYESAALARASGEQRTSRRSRQASVPERKPERERRRKKERSSSDGARGGSQDRGTRRPRERGDRERSKRREGGRAGRRGVT